MPAAASTVHNLAAHRLHRKLEVGQEYTFTDMNEVCAFVQHEIVMSKMKFRLIAEKAGCCPSTVGKMAAGETHQPRASTVWNILRVLGFEIAARRS